MTSFIHRLDDCAKVLEPFIESSRRGSLHWNGSEYAPVSEDKDPDPYALAWWSTLCTISALLSSQSSLTPQQYSYIERELFGGMGSLTDFWLDEKHGGKKARAANEQLNKIRNELCLALPSLRQAEQTQI